MRALVCIVLLLAFCLNPAPLGAADEKLSAARMMDDLMYGHGPVGAPFSLTDQHGNLRSDREFRGKLMIVYFGYTFCPDVCPTDLQSITLALQELGPLAAEVQPLFITIDPERDNKVLEDYVSAFHPSFIGLTGPPEVIRQLAIAYKVFYQKIEADLSDDYTIDHSGVIYLMGRQGEYLGFMPPQTTAERLAQVLKHHLR